MIAKRKIYFWTIGVWCDPNEVEYYDWANRMYGFYKILFVPTELDDMEIDNLIVKEVHK